MVTISFLSLTLVRLNGGSEAEDSLYTVPFHQCQQRRS
ncbi:Uncharacterised protein [Vibrio cholerae]|nr:Uncharacterised protein [Vibrio cholerae]